ncbi:uncharacterized protein [Prorops nasuta]|uniref:uncharacterized protein n=1 Tax=Prorops nasuta TaxID=863751 RepID=UPI0034CF9C68
MPNESDSRVEKSADTSINISGNKSDSSLNNYSRIICFVSDNNVRGKSSIDDKNLRVEPAPSRNTKRDFRKHFCLSCKTWQSKISRHLERKHNNEDRVKSFLDLPKKCLDRKIIIEKLRKKGDFMYNLTKEVNEGKLIVCRRPQEKCKTMAENYMACPKCKGFYNKLNFRHHTRKCIDKKSVGSKVLPILSRQVTGRYGAEADNTLRQIVLPRCREDKIIRIIRYDTLIMEYGFDHITRTYKIPSLATSLGTLLKSVGKTMVSLTIFNSDFVKQREVENFLTLLDNEYGTAVNKAALENQQQLKRCKKIRLPSIDDIRKLDKFLQNRRDSSFKSLSSHFSLNEWMNLAESTLISIQLFIRRRAGETKRMLISDFQIYEKIDPLTNKDAFDALPSDCQKIALQYARFTIRGKLSRTISVLLDQDLLQCIELLLKYRKKAGVNSDNPYIFGTPNVDKSKFYYLRACDLIRKFSVECGGEHPETLRGTTLRKHMATLGVKLNLTDSEVGDLAQFLGHAEKIHKNL